MVVLLRSTTACSRSGLPDVSSFLASCTPPPAASVLYHTSLHCSTFFLRCVLPLQRHWELSLSLSLSLGTRLRCSVNVITLAPLHCTALHCTAQPSQHYDTCYSKKCIVNTLKSALLTYSLGSLHHTTAHRTTPQHTTPCNTTSHPTIAHTKPHQPTPKQTTSYHTMPCHGTPHSRPDYTTPRDAD